MWSSMVQCGSMWQLVTPSIVPIGHSWFTILYQTTLYLGKMQMFEWEKCRC